MSTVFMKLVGAIVVGGEVVRPPAIVEVTDAEAINLAHRGKAVPATEHDVPTATTPGAEVVKGDGETPEAEAQDGASDAPVEAAATADNAATEEHKQLSAAERRQAAKAATAAAAAGK